MFFLLPDADPTHDKLLATDTPVDAAPQATEEEAPDGMQATTAPEPSSDGKGKSASLGTGSVELDLDDAPFLQEDTSIAVDEAAEPSAKEEETAKTSDDNAQGAGWKERLRALLGNKKKMALLGGVALLLLAAAIGVNFFLFSSPGSEKGSVPEAASTPPKRITLNATAPAASTAPALEGFMAKWAPFTIPLKGPEGEVALFTFEMAIPTDNEALYAELQARRVTLRDAVYYYLSRKPLDAIKDMQGSVELRQELVHVLNENLTSGKIEKVYVENYYVEHL